MFFLLLRAKLVTNGHLNNAFFTVNTDIYAKKSCYSRVTCQG